MLYHFRPILTAFLQHDGLAFAEVLSEQSVQQAFADEGVPTNAPIARNTEDANSTVYTAAVTLWAFLSQVLFKNEQRSCLAATARVVVLMASLGRKCSDNTGAYCRARAKLPTPVIQRLTLQVADGCENRVAEQWLWKGRHVHLVDGTTASMPDTAENQAEFPQSRTQQAGLGFPIARLVVLFSLATAMMTGMAMGPYRGKETGETALFRELFGRLKTGEVVLADRYYCSYFMVALLMKLGVDVVARLHQRRKSHFRQGRDHVVTWQRPAKPEWMTQETYEQMPETIQMREVHVQIAQPGFRVGQLIVATTLTDMKAYSKNEIAELYHKRWLVELDIRTLKNTLAIDVLRCKTPDMVRKELWACLLAYNLIRQSMLESALEAELSPRQLSFTAALQKAAASWMILSVCEGDRAVLLIAVELEHLAANRVGDRPNRTEPRGNKRRPKAQTYLTKPRDEARQELLEGVAA